MIGGVAARAVVLALVLSHAASASADGVGAPPSLTDPVEREPLAALWIKSARRAARSGDCATVAVLRKRIRAFDDPHYTRIADEDAELNDCTQVEVEPGGVRLSVEGAVRFAFEELGEIHRSNIYSVTPALAIGLPRRTLYVEIAMMIAGEPMESPSEHHFPDVSALGIQLAAGTQLCAHRLLCFAGGIRIGWTSMTERDAFGPKSYQQWSIGFPLKARFGRTVGIAPFFVPQIGFSERRGTTYGYGVGVELSIDLDRRFGGRGRHPADTTTASAK